MFAPAAGKARTEAALGNLVLRTEVRVTMIGGILACAVLLGLIFNAAAGWWWADPAAGYVLVYYAGPQVAARVRDMTTAGQPARRAHRLRPGTAELMAAVPLRRPGTRTCASQRRPRRGVR
jgi:hypothetical protein